MIARAVLRDRSAEQRDRRAEGRDLLSDELLAGSDAERLGAASDRRQSALDRYQSGIDRDLSAGDRADLQAARQHPDGGRVAPQPDVTEPRWQWWGPNGLTCPVADMDVRVGGRSLVCMSAPDWGFPALYSTWAYTLVDAPRRLEFVHNMSDARGTTLDMADIPHDVHHVVT